MADLLVRHFLERNDGGRVLFLEHLAHPAHDVAVPIEADDRVAERDDKRLLRDERARSQHGMAETERAPLPRVEVLDLGALDLQRGEQFFLAAFPKQLHQLFVHVEMVFERGLSGSSDKEDAPQTVASQLFADVLHHWFAADRQHLFRLRFGRRQQSRPEPGDRDDRDVDAHGRGRIIAGGRQPRSFQSSRCLRPSSGMTRVASC